MATSITQHIKNVLANAHKPNLMKFIFSLDFGKMLVDGNVAHNILVRASTGKLVGEDYHGNKYYEEEGAMYTRKRWVVYRDLQDYSPTTVPAEWHGWLNYINDYAPGKHDFKQPIYAIEAEKTKTGTSGIYQPKGAWQNPARRNWKKYEAWVPAGMQASVVNQGTQSQTQA